MYHCVSQRKPDEEKEEEDLENKKQKQESEDGSGDGPVQNGHTEVSLLCWLVNCRVAASLLASDVQSRGKFILHVICCQRRVCSKVN